MFFFSFHWYFISTTNFNCSAHCLQESVDEVFNKGFKEGWNPIPTDVPEGEDNWKDYSSSFAAKKLLPLPMTALKTSKWSEKWGGCDVHNPAPLWIVGTPDSQDRVPNHDFTLRKDVNDHSNFARVASSPAAVGETTIIPGLQLIPDANDDCKRIRDAPFRGHDQFAKQSVMDGLLSGSFVQVQDLVKDVAAPEQGKLTCLNFWNPALVEINSKIEQTFTIRNRSIGAVNGDDIPSTALPIHWALQNSTNRLSTAIYGFYWVPDGDGKHARITFNITEFNSMGDEGMGERQKLNLNESWEAKPGARMLMTTLSSNLPLGSANLTRFLLDKFLCEGDESKRRSDGNLPETLAVSMLSGQKAQIAIYDQNQPGWPKSASNTIHSLHSPCFGVAKAIGTGQSQKNLLLCNANFSGGKSKLDLYEYHFSRATDFEQIKVTDTYTRLECRLNSEEEGDSSILVRSVFPNPYLIDPILIIPAGWRRAWRRQ